MVRKLFAPLALVVTIIVVGVALERRTESAPADKVVGSGTAGRITRWFATDTVGDSVISEGTNGHIAIGQPAIDSAVFMVLANSDAPDSASRAHNNGTGRGLQGSSDGGIGVNGFGRVGINGITTSTDPNDVLAAGIRGTSSTPGVPAGYFQGDVHVNGTLTKNAGSFRIDHPLDPEHKYLSHSFVESPDMMNIYNGNVVTDANGNASVTLPNYFEALNRDFRYQLTVVGQFAQAIVSEKIRGNTFRIRSDKPGVEVSWQVTGVRRDKFAEEHRIQVESLKPKRAER
jgi:hypothetical protein